MIIFEGGKTMVHSRKPRQADRQGFTLVELLVVLGILVALAALVVPRVLSSSKKADLKKAQAQVLFLRGPLKEYALDCKDFPSTEDGLAALVREPSELSAGGKWHGPYIDGSLPKDPWGQDYQYEYPSTHGGTEPDIWSNGPDRESGTDDDIGNWSAEGDAGGDQGTKGGKGERPTKGPREPGGPKKGGTMKGPGTFKAKPPAEPTSGTSKRGETSAPISSKPQKGLIE
jgi:general secretion pathway protein G